MRTTNLLWGLAAFAFFAWFGLSVIVGGAPGAASGIGTVERLSGLTDRIVAHFGPITTGLGLVLFGVITAVACFCSGAGSPDPGFSDSCDGGCD
jgi:hypothetical protein